jgi:hypothetical protein
VTTQGSTYDARATTGVLPEMVGDLLQHVLDGGIEGVLGPERVLLRQVHSRMDDSGPGAQILDRVVLADQFLQAFVDHPCVDLVTAGLVAIDKQLRVHVTAAFEGSHRGWLSDCDSARAERTLEIA